MSSIRKPSVSNNKENQLNKPQIGGKFEARRNMADISIDFSNKKKNIGNAASKDLEAQAGSSNLPPDIEEGSLQTSMKEINNSRAEENDQMAGHQVKTLSRTKLLSSNGASLFLNN